MVIGYVSLSPYEPRLVDNMRILLMYLALLAFKINSPVIYKILPLVSASVSIYKASLLGTNL